AASVRLRRPWVHSPAGVRPGHRPAPAPPPDPYVSRLASSTPPATSAAVAYAAIAANPAHGDRKPGRMFTAPTELPRMMMGPNRHRFPGRAMSNDGSTSATPA